MKAPVSKYLLKALLFPLSLLPLRVHYALAKVLSWLACNLISYRKQEVLINLSRSFPELETRDIKSLCKEFYAHFSELIVETIWFGGCRNPERLRKAGIVRVVNAQTLDIPESRSRGAVIMYSHCGNWEILGGIENYFSEDSPCPFREDNFCVVYKEMSSAAWDAVMRDNRFAPLKDRKNFPGYIESKTLVRYVFEHRSEIKYYNINTDQRPYYSGSDNIEVSFMGRRCRTMSASAALARKFSLPVYFLRMTRESRGHYLLEYVPICRNASEMGVQEIMDRYYELLEADIRRQPANYLWTHRRWR